MVLTGAKMRAAESTHWYARNGEPCYEMQGKTGMRPTTLRDARKLGLLPSVTTIIKCAAAPALEIWKQNQVMLAALTLTRLPGESDESFCQRVIQDSQEQARKARDKGTEIHAAVQGHFENEPPHPDYWPHVKGTLEVLAANCGEQKWIAEKSFAHFLGFGGKTDLHSPEWVLDFKTKEFSPEQAPTLKTWDDHAMQLAAYQRGLNVPGSRCGIVYVSTTHPGLCRLIEIDESDLEKGWYMFEALLKFWKARCGYFPEEWQEAA